MQKKIIALAVAALASTAAFAQTNVTIYGVADAGLVGVSNLGATTGQTQYNINSGVLSTSRIGFKGVEDLGNGLKALFTLEYGLAIDDNTGVGTGTAAARQQFVGLTGGFGTAIAGRLQTTGLDFAVATSALGGSTGLGAYHNAGGGTLITAATRANNAFAYVSPSFGGVSFAYNHARMTEAALTTNATDAHADLLSVSYANGPITAGAIYTRLTNANNNEVIAPNQDDNVKEWGLRAGYDFGVAKLQAAYQQQKQAYTYTAAVPGFLSVNTTTGVGTPVPAVPASFAKTAGKDSKWVVSATVPVGAKVAVIAEYAHLSKNSTTTNDNVNVVTVASTYALSKRTTAYAGMVAKRSQELNKDTNTYAVGVRHMF